MPGVIVCLGLCVSAFAAGEARSRGPVPYKEIPDPADEAERRIVVKGEDRGPVWLLTGFLNPWAPGLELDTFKRVRTKHTRTDSWPLWSPGRPSPVDMGRYMDTMVRLREDTGMTWQVLVCFQRPYPSNRRIGMEGMAAYGDHIRTMVKYCTHMGIPIDFWELWNEAPPGPYEGVKSEHFWNGTWEEFLAMWDTVYDVIREVDPKARIVGPSYGGGQTPETLRPFLEHCKEKGQHLDVLAWHAPECVYVKGDFSVVPDAGHRNIEAIRKMVEAEYASLGIEEIHIDEWGHTIEETGPGTQIAIFYYYDLAGVDRAAKANYAGEGDLNGILVSPKTPRTSYWCWAEYARQDGGLRLVTETNDRRVVALASRHDEAKEVRVLLARSKRHTGEGFAKKLSPVKTTVDMEGIPIRGKAEVTILTLGPADGPMWEEDLTGLTARETRDITGGALTLTVNDLAENEVVSVRIAPAGTWAEEAAVAAEREEQKEASKGIDKGIPLSDLVFQEGFEEGFSDGETILGKRGWAHAKNEISALGVFQDAKGAHGGERYAQFTENYWATNDCFRKIPEQTKGILEVTAWYRFPDYEGNRNGKGYGATFIGLYETPDTDTGKGHVSFKFGTNEQNAYSTVVLTNDKASQINWRDASGLREDVRGKWHQVSLVVDMESKRVTARHRASAKEPWQVFHTETYRKMDWTPGYVLISAYNQAPDWRFCVDDIEVRSSVGDTGKTP